MKFAHFSQLFNKPGMTGYSRYEQMWRELELADDVGFDYGFQSIHHFYKLRPTPAMFCTGGAARTRRIRLGPMGYIAALYDPIRILEEALLLDQITNGRLELGLALGVYPDYYRVYGANTEKRRALTEETILLLKAGFATQGNLDFSGPFHQYENVELALRQVQSPGPPIWLPTTNRDTLAFCAREGVRVGYIHMDDRQEVAPRYREYLRLWREAGHQDPPTTGYASFVYVDESDEVAIAKATEHILFNSYEVYGRSPVGGVFSDSEDRLGPHTSENYKNLNNMDYLLERNMVFVGSPETVVNRIKAAAKEGLFNTLICEFNLGALDEQDLMRSIRTFGTQVIPALREFDPTS